MRSAVKIKDVLRMTHPRPRNEEHSSLWKSVVEDTLGAADTWEVALSAGADKKQTFERLLGEGKLGYMALLRNLRNMANAGVDREQVRQAIVARKGAHNVLPFRYVAAARAAPQFEPHLDEALCAAVDNLPVLPGLTVVLVDVSGSMGSQLSGKSDLRRIDAAATLASIIPGETRVFAFDTRITELPPRRGMAGVEKLVAKLGGGTDIGMAVRHANGLKHDRLIVITDEESMTPVPAPVAKHAYMINVAQARHEVGYGSWNRVCGFSENVLRWINQNEKPEV